MAESSGSSGGSLASIASAVKESPAAARLADEAKGYLQAKGNDLVGDLSEKLESATESLEQGGGPLGAGAMEGVQRMMQGDSPGKAAAGAAMKGVTQKVKQAFGGGGGGGGGSATKITNIVEDIDVGVPVRVAYNQWTQFADFPDFMKKLESAEQESEEKINWKAQIVWSHRTWESTIKDQVPDERIVWESKGNKGHVDGTVTFHELTPNLTRILLVLEYHPQGLFERTGNIWRAQGRRARLELKHFRRHVMTQTILEQDEVEGWRGEISDSEVVRSHDEVLEDEQAQSAGEEAEYPDEEDSAEDYADEEPADDELADEEDYGEEEGDEDEYAEDYEREPQPS